MDAAPPFLEKQAPPETGEGAHYDALDVFYRDLRGEHLQHGLWLTGRYLNVLLGLIVTVGPWIAGGAALAGPLVGSAAGLLVTVLACPARPGARALGSMEALRGSAGTSQKGFGVGGI